VDAEELAYAGLARQAELVAAGEISSVELTRTVLDRIQRVDPLLNAFRTVMAEKALAEANDRDAAAKEDRGPLHGVPIAIKDEVDVAGEVTTFGGAANVIPVAADAEVVRRLRSAGAVIVGKTRMPEFGQWPFGESAAGGYTRNPWDRSRTTGGSSAGTAAAVAAGMVAAGLGGDGGGSIRIPSACCGLFGLKGQRGRVPITPVEHLWGALGVVGPLTRRVIDSALFYDAVRGAAPGDRWTAHEPATSFVDAARAAPGRMRIAVSDRPSVRGVRLDPQQREALERTAEVCRGLGHEVAEVDVRYPDATAAFVPQFLGGVRSEADTVDRPDLLERRTKVVAALGRLVTGPVFEWAMAESERLAGRLNGLFDSWDILLTPTIAPLPRRLGVLDGAGFIRAAWRSQPHIAYTAIWNVCGNPAASVPAGMSREGLPLAVQLVGAPHDEPGILRLAAQLETAMPWADRHPDLTVPDAGP
jgi:amidase